MTTYSFGPVLTELLFCSLYEDLRWLSAQDRTAARQRWLMWCRAVHHCSTTRKHSLWKVLSTTNGSQKPRKNHKGSFISFLKLLELHVIMLSVGPEFLFLPAFCSLRVPCQYHNKPGKMHP